MRVATNETIVYQKTRSMRRLATFGMLALILSLMMSFNSQYALWSYPVLLFGTLILVLAAHATAKWGDEQRGDIVLSRVLKSLDQEYRLYNYMLPAEHVILAPSGVFVLQLQRQRGAITCEGEKCRQHLKLWENFRFLQEETLGNPMQRARVAAAKMQRYLESKLPGLTVPVTPLVVFIHPEAQLTVTATNVPVMALNDLKATLRDATRASIMPRETYAALVRLLDVKSA